MNELSGYVFSSLREGDVALYRGSGNGLTPILLVAAEETSPDCIGRLEHEYALKSELDADWAARPVALTHDNGRMTLVLEDPGGEPLDGLLGAPLELGRFLRLGHRHRRRPGQGAPAWPRPQGPQAGAYPGQPQDRRGQAHRVRHRLAPAPRAAGARAARDHCRHTRLHGARTDRPHEPVDRRSQRSLRAGRHALSDAHGRPAVHRLRSDGMGPLPYRQKAGAARRAVADYPGPGLGHHHEAARQDRRGALPDCRRRGERPAALPGRMGSPGPHRRLPRWANRTRPTGC